MTRNEIAVLLEALKASRLDEHAAVFATLDEKQKSALMLYMETWVEARIALALRQGMDLADSEDDAWANDVGMYWTKAALKQEFQRVANSHYNARRGR